MCEYIKTTFPHIYLYTSTNGLRSPRRRRAGSCTRASTRSRSQSTARRRRATSSIGSADDSTSRSRNCGRWPTKNARRPRPAVSELALHPVQLERQRRGDGARAPTGRGHRCRPAVLGADGPSRGRVFAAFGPGSPGSTPSATRSGTTTTSATPFRAPRRGRASTCARLVPGVPSDRRAPAGRCRSARACTTCRRAHSRRRPPTAGAWCASAPSSAPKTARCSIATSRAPGSRDAGPGTSADVAIEIPAPEQPGRYALKFDLVSEGIDWFEKCGSDDDARLGYGRTRPRCRPMRRTRRSAPTPSDLQDSV